MYSFDTIFSTGLLFCIKWIILSYSSSSLLHLHAIFFSGSGSSLNLDHHHWIILNHHHWIWIITQSGSSSLDWIWIITWSRSSSLDHTQSSSLDLDHHSIWIIIAGLDLDHHSIWIIIVGSSLLDHHGCYLMILLITGSSTEPFFMLFVGLASM